MEASGETERRERDLLAARLVADRGEIERRWQERAAGGGDQDGLRVRLAAYLTNLTDALRGGSPLDSAAAMAWTEASAPDSDGQPFDVERLLRELSLLRQVIGEVSRESTPGQDALVADLVEIAMAVAVRSYAEARDRATRRAQAQHGASITHDLRNPLTTALVTASQLRRNPGGAVPPDRLALLERSLGRLRTLIEGVVSAERMELEEIVPQREEVALGELMEESLGRARAVARERGLPLEVQIDPDLALLVDRKLTVAALRNLVEGSLEFTDAGPVLLRSEDRGHEVLVHVEDHCEGVSQEDLGTLFEPYRRAHGHRRSSGFALAVARRATVAQGGHVGVESSADHGCHFWLTLRKAHN